MTSQKSTKEKILKCALEEFSTFGYNGARVDRIAKSAGVNKAMLFYYYSSKIQLYEILIKKSIQDLLIAIASMITPQLTASDFIDKATDLYIDFFSENRQLVNIIAIDMIQNPDNIPEIIKKIFEDHFQGASPPLLNLINRWYVKGEITEKNPLHFMLNIVSLMIFPFIARAIPESILGLQSEDKVSFVSNRKESVKNILKRGLLK